MHLHSIEPINFDNHLVRNGSILIKAMVADFVVNAKEKYRDRVKCEVT